MSSDLRQAAMAYGKRGYRVVPLHYIRRHGRPICSCWRAENCNAAGKHPMITGWRVAATVDLDLIARWWRAWPIANIGVLMGGLARLIAIDIDGDEGRESLAKLEAEHGALPVTLTQTTGRTGGGEHRILYVPERFEINAIRNRVKVAPGIDVRAEGGLIVAAPSLHPTGVEYRWTVEGQPGELPEWFYKLATSPRERQKIVATNGTRPPEDELPPLDDRIRRATAYLAKMPEAIQGQNGSLACLKAAIAMVRGFCLPPENAFDLLWTEYNPRCVPIWTKHELMHKIEAAELVVDLEWGRFVKKNVRNQADDIVDKLYDEGRGPKADAYWNATETSTPKPVGDRVVPSHAWETLSAAGDEPCTSSSTPSSSSRSRRKYATPDKADTETKGSGKD